MAPQAKSLGEQEWRSQQLGLLGGHHFESDTEMSDMDEDDRETLFSSVDLLSPGGHSDAQTLAMMLQEQLDAINKEIRYAPPGVGGVPAAPPRPTQKQARASADRPASQPTRSSLANALIIPRSRVCTTPRQTLLPLLFRPAFALC